jgi:beta-glucosidase-like glycosyl hydrolase/CubicO group peptidase (beta-lactamase class C family)
MGLFCYLVPLENLAMKKMFLLGFSLLCTQLFAQQFMEPTPAAKHWADSVFATLSNEQKIAQLMIIRAHSNLGEKHVQEVTDLINKYNVGGLCFFQGGPVRQAMLTNKYQQLAKTPLMICIDGEWGLGMRLDSVINFPRQLMMGAVPDAQLIYAFGKAVGQQCKRIGIQVNYAPDIDVNNNPNNPVINDRSFGEDKYKVALYGTQYMKGMQDVGVMACAKHFPGHGDVAVDSHLDLPVINKSRQQLDSLELYPFRELIKAGVGSMMVAHLYIPSIDTIANQATSLSKKNVTGLLRNELGYNGLTFTDALEMKGVAKFYPSGEAAVQSLIAGNDMLCLPGDVPGSIQKVLGAINTGKLSWADINSKVMRVLLSKYHLGLYKVEPIALDNITADLNAATNGIRQQVSKQALTLLRLQNEALLPLQSKKKVAFVGIGINQMNAFAAEVKEAYNAKIFLMDYKDSTSLPTLLKKLKRKYKKIIVSVSNYSRRPANNYGLSKDAVTLLQYLQEKDNAIIFTFGNPYAIKNFCNAKNLIAAYEDDNLTQLAASELLQGKITAKGKLPVTVCEDFKFGAGITANHYMPYVQPENVGLSSTKLAVIDTIVDKAIAQHAMPGCVVLVAKNGKVAYEKAFGYTNYDSAQAVTTNMVYDLASVTKISATTVSIMKLYEEGKIDLGKTLGDYLPWTKGTNKASLKLKDILLHQAGLNPFIPFYREVIDTATGIPNWNVFSKQEDANHLFRAAENLYVRNDWQDSLYKRILTSKLTEQGKYVYSDNDFIFLGKIVEAVSGKPLNDYARETFYLPLQMMSTTYQPRKHYILNDIVPTELEKHFRQQLIRGDVHDEGSAMFGGVAGHAGLFSNAYDLAQLYQMLLNGGEINGLHFLQKQTIDKFTAYNSDISRRGLGFDKPEKDNATRKEPYPSKSASAETYGHTGFTGICVWVDPKENLIYIFLSNRVTPTRNNNKLSQLNVRPNIQEAIYEAIKK